MKGSPFKLRSPLKLGNLSDKSLEIQSASLEGQESKANAAIELNNVSTGAPDKVIQESPNETAKRNARVVNKGEGTTAFDRDGRSVDKFDQRIAHAESKGKLGRAQRLKNRKSGFMEGQANKLERAGGKLTDDQKGALNAASKDAKGTRVGRALRVLGGKEAKQRPISTEPVSLNSANNKDSESLTTGNSSSRSINLGDNFFGKVTENIKQPTDYEKYVNSKSPEELKDGIDTEYMFYNK